MGTILGAALLSAVLASGGTVVALSASGALDRSAPAQANPTGTTVGTNNQPVTIDESSATIEVAAAASPAVVRITIGGSVSGRSAHRHRAPEPCRGRAATRCR
ncbi:MAG: hypothetical protein ACTS8Z_08330, partial [Candidatus Limnocylindrales bacterium]